MNSEVTPASEKMVHIIGGSSKVSQILVEKLNGTKVSIYGRNADLFLDPSVFVEGLDKTAFHIFVYMSSILYATKMSMQTENEMRDSFKINCWIPCSLLEILNDAKVYRFKFIYISSESAKKGSYDSSYALSKAASERFIKEVRLKNKASSCFGVAPSTIADAGMTISRTDKSRLENYRLEHPKQRFLTSDEIASLLSDLINSKIDYLTNTIIDLNGGKFSRSRY